MKNIVVADSKKKITMIDIKNVELELQTKLPTDYIAFMLKHNGGHPLRNQYPLIEIFDFYRYGWGSSTISDCEIDWFYGIYDGEYNNFIEENKRKEDVGIPGNLVSIGCSSVGDVICIGVEENNSGKVYYWGHDWERGEEYKSVALISNNFSDFIDSLYGLDIELYESREGGITARKDKLIHDRYSIPFSTEAKRYGEVVTGFFRRAPIEVEEYIMEETESTKDLLLWYEVKSEGKKYCRKISDGQVEDYEQGSLTTEV
ncbi:SMI1/KNR4 family protein [Rickettsiales endosymbiont of Peranema trichophorum]|uniref:SMI1/KNR4 family protein n=1 Tax=Rickettsiales endosymbiont of Peranema trichophorum TaxID=2486577 RepID=UPI0013EE8CCB|nr:SMI1/KNR4 family protein [Rickettsiales endosymbiont of Peranema trichophorum]